jgi:hypothetical protein
MPAYVNPSDMFDAVLAAQRHLLGWQKRAQELGDSEATGR